MIDCNYYKILNISFKMHISLVHVILAIIKTVSQISLIFQKHVRLQHPTFSATNVANCSVSSLHLFLFFSFYYVRELGKYCFYTSKLIVYSIRLKLKRLVTRQDFNDFKFNKKLGNRPSNCPRFFSLYPSMLELAFVTFTNDSKYIY